MVRKDPPKANIQLLSMSCYIQSQRMKFSFFKFQLWNLTILRQYTLKAAIPGGEMF